MIFACESKFLKSRAEVSQLKEANTQMKSELTTQRAKTDRNTIQELILQAQEKVNGLKRTLAKAEDTVTALTDKIIFLVQEKANLSVSLAHYKR